MDQPLPPSAATATTADSAAPGPEGYAPFASSSHQDQVLERVLGRAGAGTVAVLDLDGCLFDTRWRQVQILREYASHRDLPHLFTVGVQHFRDWSLSHTLARAGVPGPLIQEIRTDLRAFWEDRFFNSAYVGHDHPMPGAVRLARALHAAGTVVAYLTGRDRGMHPGTQAALDRFGFPQEAEGAILLTKPDAAMADEAWKAQALPQLVALGEPAVFLDNEPVNVNLFRRSFPRALVVFVSTDHSFRPDRPHPDIPRVRGFLRTTDGVEVPDPA